MTTTTNIKLSTPAHGSNVDTWNADPINNNSAILDAVLGGVTSKALTNINVALTATEAQAGVLRFSGILTGNVAINVSAIISEWDIENLTTGAFVVTITGGSGNVVGVPQGDTVRVRWDGTNCKITSLPFIGSYLDDCGATVPAWITACTVPPYLLCDGSTFSAVTYPYLASRLGTTTLPDLGGRARFYLNGGTGRITTAGSGIDGDTRFAAGGGQNVTLDVSQIPAHPHPVSVLINGAAPTLTLGGVGQTTIAAGGSFFGVVNPTTLGITAAATNTGGGLSHSSMPPAQISGITMIRAG